MTLARLVEVLGPSVVRVLATPGLEDVTATEVVVHDIVDPPELRPGDVLLAVGVVATSDDACSLVRSAGRVNAASVVVRSREMDLPRLREAAVEAGMSVLVLAAAMRWEQISVLIRHAIFAVSSGLDQSTVTGDLFGFANALAQAVSGAVTVEDATSHVLSYSTLHVDEFDAPRTEAILGRQVPEVYLRHLHASGVLGALETTDEIVEVPADETIGLRRRLVVAVRAHGETLGSIWVQEGRVRLGSYAAQVLAEAARVAPGHLVRAQSSGLTLRQRREDVLRGLLEGDVDVRAAAAALGFKADLPCAVVAIALDSVGMLGTDQHAFRRLDELLSARATAYRWMVAAVWSKGRLLVLVPELTGLPDQMTARLERLAKQLAEDARVAGLSARVACGPVVSGLDAAAATVQITDRILQFLAHEPTRGPVATYAATRSAIAVTEAVAALAAVPSLREGPVARLLEHDRSHDTKHQDTLRAWLDSLGDSAVAARRLDVHPNTVRYRLQRIVELSGICLDDPDERLVATLHLLQLGSGLRSGPYGGA